MADDQWRWERAVLENWAHMATSISSVWRGYRRWPKERLRSVKFCGCKFVDARHVRG